VLFTQSTFVRTPSADRSTRFCVPLPHSSAPPMAACWLPKDWHLGQALLAPNEELRRPQSVRRKLRRNPLPARRALRILFVSIKLPLCVEWLLQSSSVANRPVGYRPMLAAPTRLNLDLPHFDVNSHAACLSFERHRSKAYRCCEQLLNSAPCHIL